MLFTSKEKQQPSRDESDFKDPHLVISQNKRKSPPLVTAKVVQHQEKKARADVASPQAIKTKVKVKKLENRKAKKGVHVGIPTQPRRIHIRTSPNLLFSTMYGVTNGQKEYLSFIGFGPLLNIKVDGSASRIGYYVVNNFDPERMVLNVDRGEIPITRQLIHDMLGLPVGNININSVKFTAAEDKTIDLWSAQFNSENDIRPKGVQRAIKRLKDVGLLFKVNFLVLICNTLRQSKSMGTCDVSMLSRVSEDFDLSDIDWCSYVLECLKNTKHAWNSMSDTSYYVGPIVLLTLIYLEHVSCDAVTIDRGRPAICLWDVETMRLREEYEIRNGGIGSGELQDPYIPQDDNAENVNSANGSVEEYLSTIESMFTKLVEDNNLMDSKLVETIERHPLVCDFYEWKAKIRIFHNEASAKYGGGSSTDAGSIGPLSQWWSDNAEQINRSCQMVEHSVKSFHNSPFPNFSIEMTQEFADIISNLPLKDIMKTPKDHCLSPLPLSIVPIHSDDVPVRARELRPRNKLPVLRSPFIVRAIDITKRISRAQKDLSEWVFSTQGHPSDELFRTCAGVAVERFHMESFFPICELFGHVLDCGSHLLNFDEDLRSNLSPRILFATTTLTLFMPFVREFHIFLVVLDFQQPAFWIIDNIKRDVDTYGLLPDVIHSYMSKYLRSVHHPNAKAFSHVPGQIPQLSWSTVHNSTDCGIFTMRHMETFMGGNIRDFKTGFKPESLAQDNQLSRLRVIYLCKIINSDYKLLKDSILHQVAEFQKLNAANRKQLLKDAANQDT
ncbi:unnamed protein product [Lactuca virosa]|uniref:Ubiquitin-like protease family profile domain-containing protein n=1 Tax=Lactuca virosa TaxID=75947 RepID=A0AAU9MMW2_9ASTR|nr:unnamed protein product [Lactuca virosa]